jgi:hypothetical protein
MFKIILPESLPQSASYKNALLRFLKVDKGFDLPLELKDRTSFILTQNGKWNFPGIHSIFGGAVLYPQKISSSPLKLLSYGSSGETLRKLFSSFQPRGGEYWTARIFVCLEKTSSPSDFEPKEFAKYFWEKLYEALKLFGVEKEIESLILTLPIDDALDVLIYGVCPHALKIELASSEKKLSHGVLFLKENLIGSRKGGASVIPFPALKDRLSNQRSSIFSGRKK